MNELIYLASPYTHHSPEVVTQRFNDVCLASAKLMNLGIFIYSPIAHTHPVALAGSLPTSWEFWAKYDEMMLKACSELWILTLDGWAESKGVAGEIEIMTRLGKPIYRIHPKSITLDYYCAMKHQ